MTAAVRPPSGDQIELRHGEQTVVVVTGGGGIRSYVIDGRDVLDGFTVDQSASSGRGQLLVPWPNRVRDGRYHFDGVDRQLSLSEPEQHHAIHGFTRWHTWEVVEQTDHRAVLQHGMVGQPGYPWPLAVRAEHALDAAGLTVRLTTTNVGATAVPYGAGAHPYLRAGDGLVDGWRLRIPAATRLLADDRQIPIGREAVAGTAWDFREPRLIGDMKIDTAFTDLIRDEDGRARVVIDDPSRGLGATLWMDVAHPFLMIFTGDTVPDRPRHGLGVEPMTCAPNALASGDGLTVLQPGESHTSSWGITPSELAQDSA